MSESELEDAASWKIRQLKPFDLDLEKIKFGIIPWEINRATASAQRKVTVFCVSSEVIDRRVGLMAQFGLKALSLEAAPQALLNFRRATAALSPGEEVTLFIDLGAEESTLAVARGGAVLFTRNLTVTSGQLTRQLAQSGRMEPSRAETLKRHHGLSGWADKASGEEAAFVFKAIASSLENLAIDVEHSFKHFSYQVSQSEI